MVIDFHTHVFPDFLASKAMGTLAAQSQYPPKLDGTLSALKESMKRAGIDRSVTLNIATNAKQTEKVNDFAISCVGEEGIIPFGSVHPEFEHTSAEFARLAAAGIKGIKFHPDFQDFDVDDRRMYKLYEQAAAYGFVMLFHCGKDLDARQVYHCTPERFARVVRDFAGAKIVGAHLGGQGMWSEVLECVCGLDVYLDVSYAFGWLSGDELGQVLARHDPDKLLFGTDSPWEDQQKDVEMMRRRIESDALYNKIMGDNAARLLGL